MSGDVERGEELAGEGDYSEYEERLAQQRASAIEAGRRKGGIAGAAMAGAMLAVGDIIDGPPKDDAPVVVDANSDPDDIDRDGISLDIDGQRFESKLDP